MDWCRLEVYLYHIDIEEESLNVSEVGARKLFGTSKCAGFRDADDEPMLLGRFHWFDARYGCLKVDPCQLLSQEKVTELEILDICVAPTEAAFTMGNIAHVLGQGRALFVLKDLDEKLRWLTSKLKELNGLALVRFCEVEHMHDQELCLVPCADHTLLLYALPLGSLKDTNCSKREGHTQPSRQGLMQCAQLALVIGVEETLVRIYDLEHVTPPRETEYAMLAEFDKSHVISLPGGHRIESTMEPSFVISTESKQDQNVDEGEEEQGKPANKKPKLEQNVREHPVLRLSSPEGEVICIKLPFLDGHKSYMIHIRPGWNELRNYIANGNNKQDGKTVFPLFRIHVVYKRAMDRQLALELWKLLDKRQSLFPLEEIEQRVHSSNEKTALSLAKVMDEEGLSCDSGLYFGVDTSVRWADGTSLIWPIRKYDPYVAPMDFGLSAVLHAIHAIRNMFFERTQIVHKELKEWMHAMDAVSEEESRAEESVFNGAQPSIPNLEHMVQIQKQRWLQEFQTPQGKSMSKELATAKDYADPLLRNKWHLIIDTNVLHHCAGDNFEFFKTLEHTHGNSIVMVIPFATVQELDWQKHNAKEPKKLGDATASIRYLNSQANAGSRFIVMQSMEEDLPHQKKHKDVRPFNAQNDMRVFECAKSRVDAGCKTLVISGDTNLRNICLSSGVPALRFQNLWQMLGDKRYQRLDVAHWMGILQDKAKRRK